MEKHVPFANRKINKQNVSMWTATWKPHKNQQLHTSFPVKRRKISGHQEKGPSTLQPYQLPPKESDELIKPNDVLHTWQNKTGEENNSVLLIE